MSESQTAERAQNKKGVSDVYLIVDARERAVIPFIETEFQEHAYVTKQVNTGDYLICQKPTAGTQPIIRACIERKTYEDFAASFKDGRYENIKKMRALRTKTGCQLYYIIEGPAFPHPNRRFARIPYSSILSAITKLMVRDGVFIVQTEDESHTAKRLVDLMRVFETETPYAAVPPVGEAADGDDAATGGDLVGEGALVIPTVITARIEQTDDDAIVNVWARLRGVSVVLGKILSREFTIAELVTQKVPIDRIRALKTSTGRPINKDALASLLAVRINSAEHAVKLVSGLRNITPAVAKLILDSAGGLVKLCSYPAATLAMVAIPQKNRTIKLGQIRADRIRRMLHYKEGGAPPEEPAGHVLGGAQAAKASHLKVTPEAAAAAAEADLCDLAFDAGGDADEGSEADDGPPLEDSEVDAILAAAGFA